MLNNRMVPKATLGPWSKGITSLLLLLFVMVPDGAALAECSDSPGPGVDLSSANIARARFGDAQFEGANLTGAYTLLAHFEGADLSRTGGLQQDQLEIACGDDETKLPADLTRPASWPCGA